jgi:hypothetical protein
VCQGLLSFLPPAGASMVTPLRGSIASSFRFNCVLHVGWWDVCKSGWYILGECVRFGHARARDRRGRDCTYPQRHICSHLRANCVCRFGQDSTLTGAKNGPPHAIQYSRPPSVALLCDPHGRFALSSSAGPKQAGGTRTRKGGSVDLSK